jgi:hypothetical protein
MREKKTRTFWASSKWSNIFSMAPSRKQLIGRSLLSSFESRPCFSITRNKFQWNIIHIWKDWKEIVNTVLCTNRQSITVNINKFFFFYPLSKTFVYKSFFYIQKLTIELMNTAEIEPVPVTGHHRSILFIFLLL